MEANSLVIDVQADVKLEPLPQSNAAGDVSRISTSDYLRKVHSKVSIPPPFDSVQLLPSTKRSAGTALGYRTSHFPKGGMTPELEWRVSLLSAYKAVVASGDFPRRNIPRAPRSRSSTKLRPCRNDSFDFYGLERSLDSEKKCEDCKLAVCRCCKRVPDEYLDKIAVRIHKSRSRLREGKQRPKPQPQLRSLSSFHRELNTSTDSQSTSISPMLPTKLGTVLRKSFGGENIGSVASRAPRPRTGKRKTAEELTSLLKVFRANVTPHRQLKSVKARKEDDIQ